LKPHSGRRPNLPGSRYGSEARTPAYAAAGALPRLHWSHASLHRVKLPRVLPGIAPAIGVPYAQTLQAGKEGRAYAHSRGRWVGTGRPASGSGSRAWAVNRHNHIEPRKAQTEDLALAARDPALSEMPDLGRIAKAFLAEPRDRRTCTRTLMKFRVANLSVPRPARILAPRT
jgi:hypothetical protein